MNNTCVNLYRLPYLGEKLMRAVFKIALLLDYMAERVRRYAITVVEVPSTTGQMMR